MRPSSPNFRFQHFTVWHDRCAMKVGTDGVLLGAWCPLPPMSRVRVLDIGTGSGLIALMIAQRLEASGADFMAEGIDIQRDAAEQAAENFRLSPWSERLISKECALQAMREEVPFELIVSNPPYFQDSLKNPDAARADARHTDKLTYQQLLYHTRQLLAEDGLMAVILPAEVETSFLALAAQEGLSPVRIMRVYPKPEKPVKRVMLALQHTEVVTAAPQEEMMYIESATAPRSEEYANLTKDFYL